MKIALEDSDIDKIAKAVAKVVGKAAPPKGKAAAEAEADAGDADAGDADFENGEAADAGDAADAGEAPDRDAVKAALTAVSKKHDQDTAMAILKKVGGVSALSKLEDDKFAAVIKACAAKK